ncbi:MAG: translation initiation factor IF-2 [Candidatus Sungbacteria bacterium]|uniref:Translation initiation factor IF-2 n=1 Tax=Candidatus Sungiibacteriota bacterium TaxID=2750080 RepID=A0A9D6QU73_9BACT|nr:translation initiation factor IF-2 [Candidatus Sungbacteria bacterium]
MAKTEIKNQKTDVGVARPPVIVVMGHVDHGKTSLLDYIRKSRVAEKETGGITQHIGAYTIGNVAAPSSPKAMEGQRKMTFIDTPGHEAFTAMRSRGARVADIGVLVVAADEGVKPQTKEAISILKAAAIPFVVALNKIDRPGKDVEKVKQELSVNEVQVESWGGKIPSVEVSAKTGEGIDTLLETILLLAELEELSSNPKTNAKGVVIESHRDPRRGGTATLLVREGSLRRGDFIVIDAAVSSVKIFEDFQGNAIREAGPSDPVRIAGLSEVPNVGSDAEAFASKSAADQFAASKARAHPQKAEEVVGGKSYINVILKTDVSGSKEAIEGVLQTMQLPDVGIRLIRSEVGDVNDSDAQLALSSTNVVIIGFKVKMPAHLFEQLKNSDAQIIQGEIIYEIFDKLKEAIKHLIPAEIREVIAGKLKVLKFFKTDKSRQVIGGRVVEGKLNPGLAFRVLRKNTVLGQGKIIGLQNRKEAISEVAEGNECGLLAEADMLIQENDVLEAYREERIERSF